MKIGKGVRKEGEVETEITAYISKCSTSLMKLLEDSHEVTIKAMGNIAIANVMKTIARVSKRLEEENKTLSLEAPAFVFEAEELAVFNIKVKVC